MRKAKKKDQNMLWLAEKIIDAYNEYGFISAVIFGKQGSGKTTYAMKAMRDVFYKLYNLSTKDDAWQYVRKYYFFELPDALEVIYNAFENDQRIPVILFDDAGIWLSKYQWYEKYMIVFYKLYALIRTRVSAVIFTSPSPDDIALFLREKGWIQIRIKWSNKKDRIAEADLYKKVFDRDSRGNIITKAEYTALDQFKVQLPDNFLKEYLEKRRETERKLLDELRQILASYKENKAMSEAS
jgi:hypothetical protein